MAEYLSAVLPDAVLSIGWQLWAIPGNSKSALQSEICQLV